MGDKISVDFSEKTNKRRSRKRLGLEKEVESVLRECDQLPAWEFMRKYGLETKRQTEGFLKALKWVLEKMGKENGEDSNGTLCLRS